MTLDTTKLDALVSKFRAGSPNIAAAFDETRVLLGGLDARLLRLEGPAPVPPSPPSVASAFRFPAAFHLWGGNTAAAMAVCDLVVASDSSQGNPKAARAAGNPGLIALSHMAIDPWNPDWRLRRSFATTYGQGLQGGAVVAGAPVMPPFQGLTDVLLPNAQGTLGAWLPSDNGCRQLLDNIIGYALHQPETANLVTEASYYGWKVGKGAENEWDGIFSDNFVWGLLIHAGWFYGSGCPISSSAWDAGLKSIAKRLAELTGGRMYGGNRAFQSDDPGARALVNFGLHEQLETTISQGPAGFATLLGEVELWRSTPDAFGRPKILAVMHDVKQADAVGMRFGLACATIAGGAYMPYDKAGAGHASLYFPAEMTRAGQRGYLGLPTGSVIRSGNTFSRPFEHGVVSANFDTKTGAFGP